MHTVDVVVVGAGHQGLVAATVLADAGLKVLVLEQATQVGGAIVSAELTLPGYVHDVYATNMNLFLGSPFYAKYQRDLAAVGVKFAHSAKPFASVFPGGSSLRVTSDEAETARMWNEHSEADARGWKRLEQVYQDFTSVYFPLYTHPLPSGSMLTALRAAWRGRKRMPIGDLARLLLSSTRSFGDTYFETAEAKALGAAWGMHLDYAPDIASGALFPLLELYGGMRGGMNLVEGGAGRLTEGLAELVRLRGGEVRTGTEVAQVISGKRGATGVRTAAGEQIAARFGVIATVPLPGLIHGLMDEQEVPAGLQRAAESYRFGPGTFMLHLALDGPIPWADPRLAEFAYVHVGGYLDDMARTYQQAMAGVLPDLPLLVVGQSSAVDPTRVPTAGHHTVWIQVRAVPAKITADAGASAETDLAGVHWDQAKALFGERMIDLLEGYAPGFRQRIIASTSHSPTDLEAANPNLVGGDSVSGSHHLDQLLGLRPSLATARYSTPIPGLYLAGAGSWPGAGANGISGQLSAERLLRKSRLRRAGRSRRRTQRQINTTKQQPNEGGQS